MCFLALFLTLCASCATPKTYDWRAIDALMQEIGEESNSYFADGTLFLQGVKYDIYYQKDENTETIIRLQKWYKPTEEYYELTFNKHYYTLMEGYIVDVDYQQIFHYTDVTYSVETAGIDCFKGEEKIETRYQGVFYQVQNRKMKNGEFVSCDYTERPTFGFQKEETLSLPQEDSVYLNELLTFGYAETTRFLKKNDLTLFYK